MMKNQKTNFDALDTDESQRPQIEANDDYRAKPSRRAKLNWNQRWVNSLYF